MGLIGASTGLLAWRADVRKRRYPVEGQWYAPPTWQILPPMPGTRMPCPAMSFQCLAVAAGAARAALTIWGLFLQVKCSKLYSDRVVLVGDAGHSMFPALGQGCNSAIESAAALVESIRRADSMEAALEAYSDDRLPETSAAADMSAMVRALPPWKRRAVTFEVDKKHLPVYSIIRLLLIFFKFISCFISSPWSPSSRTPLRGRGSLFGSLLEESTTSVGPNLRPDGAMQFTPIGTCAPN